MKQEWLRILYIVGVVALIAGAIDPLEGSVLIGAGSTCLTAAAWQRHDRHRVWFFATFLLMMIGIFFLFFLSSLGGFGGNSTLSWWWGTLILPYPIGWLVTIALLIRRAFQPKAVNP